MSVPRKRTLPRRHESKVRIKCPVKDNHVQCPARNEKPLPISIGLNVGSGFELCSVSSIHCHFAAAATTTTTNHNSNSSILVKVRGQIMIEMSSVAKRQKRSRSRSSISCTEEPRPAVREPGFQIPARQCVYRSSSSRRLLGLDLCLCTNTPRHTHI